jgi:hypothetical protein
MGSLAFELRNQFTYDPKQPVSTEGWLQKAKIRFTGPHWQRRYFRLQGRCLYYFKKVMGEPPCGFIPLLNIEIKDFQSKKKGSLQFVVKIGRYIDQASRFPKRLEYPLQADTEDSYEKWKQVILAKSAHWLVGEPLEVALSVTPSDSEARCLLPYFIPPFLAKLDQPAEIGKRGIWATDVPANLLAIGLSTINLNVALPLDDTQNAIGYVVAFLKALPQPLLPGADYANPTAAALRQAIEARPAPVRQLLKVLILHFNRVLEFKAQNKSNDSVFKFFEPVLAADAPSPEAVRKCLMANAAEIFEDIHQFREARRQPALFRGRLKANQPEDLGEDLLPGERGLILTVVRQDELGWCTVYTANGRIGLLHESVIARLTPEEEQELGADGGKAEADAKMDVVREKIPDLVLLLEAMQVELTALERATAA